MPDSQVTVGGNGSFIGLICPSQADCTMIGGGHSDIEAFTGSAVSLTTKFNGHFAFHYGESLANLSNSRHITATSWDEL